MKPSGFLFALGLGAALQVSAQHGHDVRSPYAGMQDRAIKSLSDADIRELRRGGGWGLALPAELNGVPGPAHLLELREQIPLTPEQASAVQALFDDMQESAIAAGGRLIEAESAIEAAFSAGAVEEEALRRLLAAAESARAELRFIHLSQHSKAKVLLEPEQIERYKVLRGYGDDPCKAVPEGHDPERYRRHMGCE